MKTSLLALVSSLALALGACAANTADKSGSDLTAVDADGGAPADGMPPGCGDGPMGHRGPPPPEAIAACDGLAAGAACGFALDGGTLQGICRTDPRGQGPLACAPDAPPPDGTRPPPPPPEAVDACASSSSGAACSFTHDGQSIDGTCEPGPDASAPLACRPTQPPPGSAPDGSQPPPAPPQEAVDACAGSSSGAACSFTHDGQSIDGTCEPGPDASAPLACRPALPPPGGTP